MGSHHCSSCESHGGPTGIRHGRSRRPGRGTLVRARAQAWVHRAVQEPRNGGGIPVCLSRARPSQRCPWCRRDQAVAGEKRAARVEMVLVLAETSEMWEQGFQGERASLGPVTGSARWGPGLGKAKITGSSGLALLTASSFVISARRPERRSGRGRGAGAALGRPRRLDQTPAKVHWKGSPAHAQPGRTVAARGPEGRRPVCPRLCEHEQHRQPSPSARTSTANLHRRPSGSGGPHGVLGGGGGVPGKAASLAGGVGAAPGRKCLQLQGAVEAPCRAGYLYLPVSRPCVSCRSRPRAAGCRDGWLP